MCRVNCILIYLFMFLGRFWDGGQNLKIKAKV